MTVREQIRKILEDVHQRDCATTMGSPGPFPCDCDIDKKIDSILDRIVLDLVNHVMEGK